MATFQIKITGGNQAAIQAKVERIKQQANAAVQGAGINTEAYAKQRCPVDSGRLRSSIKYTPTAPNACTIGTPVKYAAYVEHGTYASRDEPYVSKPTGMRPRPFLFPAFQQAKKEFLAEVRGIK